MTNSDVPGDSLKTSKTVEKLVEPLFNRGRVLWMDNFYTLPNLCLHLKKNGLRAAWILTEQEDFPLAVKEANLKQGEHMVLHSQTVMVIK